MWKMKNSQRLRRGILNMAIEVVRVSEKGRNHLISLKRRTGIENWNVLCRWSFCLSLSEKTIPPPLEVRDYSNVEMIWKVFGGEYADIYYLLLRQRCKNDGMELTDSVLETQFRLHLHRGIGYLHSSKDLTLLGLLQKGCVGI